MNPVDRLIQKTDTRLLTALVMQLSGGTPMPSVVASIIVNTKERLPPPVDITDSVATAMAAKRAELINKPLARIWKELAAVAIATAEAT